jgi:ferritin
MRLNEKVQDVINKQINAELWSAYLYLSMSAYFESEGFAGFASWMRVQYQEETAHAMKMFNFVNERGGRVTLKPIMDVPTEWKSPLDAFEETYKHECLVTDLINNCVNVAMDERDHASVNFFKWFVDEQVEEEATVSGILDELRITGSEGHALFMINRDLGSRVFIDTTITK